MCVCVLSVCILFGFGLTILTQLKIIRTIYYLFQLKEETRANPYICRDSWNWAKEEALVVYLAHHMRADQPDISFPIFFHKRPS